MTTINIRPRHGDARHDLRPNRRASLCRLLESTPNPVAGAMLQDPREHIHLENHVLFARAINPAA
ncbi:hypothetical protein [Pseudomonas extremaustralis]|uniref:hypothetical protein n=1 Tax=Pseudomonas extremaustralis TaxID=359110 RepID=UPI002AA0DF3F|nr:hypothetical protein [Pseudomonas extremaustralis]